MLIMVNSTCGISQRDLTLFSFHTGLETAHIIGIIVAIAIAIAIVIAIFVLNKKKKFKKVSYFILFIHLKFNMQNAKEVKRDRTITIPTVFMSFKLNSELCVFLQYANLNLSCHVSSHRNNKKQ